jgi:hypothetical protein
MSRESEFKRIRLLFMAVNLALGMALVFFALYVVLS